MANLAMPVMLNMSYRHAFMCSDWATEFYFFFFLELLPSFTEYEECFTSVPGMHVCGIDSGHINHVSHGANCHYCLHLVWRGLFVQHIMLRCRCWCTLFAHSVQTASCDGLLAKLKLSYCVDFTQLIWCEVQIEDELKKFCHPCLLSVCSSILIIHS